MGVFSLSPCAQAGFSDLLRPGLLHGINLFQKGLNLYFSESLAIGVEFAQ
jgi:hypothetical protein